MSLDPSIASRLRLPLIAAPMLRVSGPDLVSAACRSGVIGAFPTVNARTTEGLDAWLTRIEEECARVEGPTAPVCPNIIMRSDPAQLAEDLGVLIRHEVPMVIASVGSPERIIGPLHDVGCLVLADVASMEHVQKALDAGVDGLVLLSAGAGGNTGWVNGLAFVRAVREMYDGPLGLAGGISDGAALLAAQVLGCDFALMGTRFIATTESLASAEYQAMLVSSRIDDIALTRGISGLEANFLRPSLLANDLDPEELAKPLSAEQARERFGAYSANLRGPRRWLDLWSAGHTVSAVRQTHSVRNLVDSLAEEYRQARSRLQQVTAADTVMIWTK